MKNKFSQTQIILLLALSLTTAISVAQKRDGVYFGLDLGAFFPSDINTQGRDTDLKDISCDGHLYPNACTTPARGTS